MARDLRSSFDSIPAQQPLQHLVQEWEAVGDDSVPPGLTCPLSLEMMVDPVLIASGQTCERAYVERWFGLGNTTCPITGQALPHTEVLPNKGAKAMIADWCRSHNVTLPDKVTGKDKASDRAAVAKSTQPYLWQSPSQKAQFRGQRLQEFRDQMLASPSMGERRRLPSPGTSVASISSFRASKSETAIPKQDSCRASRAQGPLEGRRGVSATLALPRLGSGKVHAEPAVEAVDDEEIATCLEQATSASGQELQDVAGRLRTISRVSREARCRMMRLGGAPVLIQLLQGGDPTVVEQAVTTILNLALEQEHKRPLAVAGAVAPLLALMTSAESTAAKQNALGAISNLAVAGENRELLHSMGVVPLLLAFLQDSESVRCRKDAAIALFNLSLELAVRQELLGMGVVELVVDLLEKEGGELEEELALLLYSLTKCKDACERLVEAEGVGQLAPILEGRKARAQGHAVAALLQVAQSSAQGLQAVRAEVVFASLATVAKTESTQGQKKAAALMKLLRSG